MKKNLQNAVVVKLNGRMANQLFIWAFIKKLKKFIDLPVLIDDSITTPKLNCFNCFNEFNKMTVQKSFINKLAKKTIPFRSIRNYFAHVHFDLPVKQEHTFCKFEENLFKINSPTYIDGYFQTEMYFADIKEEILNDFKLNTPLDNKNKTFLNKIKTSNSISLHIRRGDYLKHPDKLGNCSFEYYKKAVDFIIQKTQSENPVLFIFSDDIKWAKKHATFEQKTIYVDINNPKKGCFDLELMKHCKHNIIANSSFSWWGAWLNQNPEKLVIAPNPWFKEFNKDFDIIPKTWHRISM